jgi:predicted dehydrogenase
MTMVRWGLLSTARINRRVIPAIRSSSRGSLVAVASRSAEAAQAYASEWEIPRAFPTYEALLESDGVDAVYVSLPNHLHAEWTVRALRSGKHVLCEKPLALTLDEVDRMSDAARETGRVLAEAFMYRHHPQTKIVGDWVRAGRLGEVHYARGFFAFPLDRPQDARWKPECGGGSLWDVGVYPVSFSQFVMGGPPESVSATQVLGPTGVDETFAGELCYAGSRMAQIGSSFRTAFHTTAEVVGTKGRLALDRPFTMVQEGRLVHQPLEGPAEVVPVPSTELYAGEIEDMHAAILDGTPSYLGLSESRDHVRTVLALQEAARTGTVVRLT